MERKIEEWVISVDMSDPMEYNHAIIEKKRLVRCRDCKYIDCTNTQKVNVDYCVRLDMYVEPDSFCAWGKTVNE